MHEGGLGFKLESKHLVMAIALGFALLWPLLVQLKRFRVFAPLAPPIALLPIALAIVAAEMSYPVELTGEGAELMCGLLFLASAVLATDRRPSRVSAWIAAPLVAGVVLSIVMGRLAFGSDEDGQQVARAELEQLRVDLTTGAARPKLITKNIHKRLFTAARDGYLRFAGGKFLEGQGSPAETAPAGETAASAGLATRTDRRGYLLDPWNNPYWIVFSKRTHSGAIYSFGPNRRRDLAIRNLSADPGDDILIRFELPVVEPAGSDEPVDRPGEDVP
jgi:hypothetical protein